jgi:hypothetical protein
MSLSDECISQTPGGLGFRNGLGVIKRKCGEESEDRILRDKGERVSGGNMNPGTSQTEGPDMNNQRKKGKQD